MNDGGLLEIDRASPHHGGSDAQLRRSVHFASIGFDRLPNL
jgi:hypothetical protein